MGRALMGTGYGRGDNRALEAAEIACNSPLLDDISIEGATGILINFTAGPDIKTREIHAAASFVQQAAHEDANIIFGLVTDPDMGDVIKVTVIATGFEMQPGESRACKSRDKRIIAPGVGGVVAAGVRAAAQQVLSRSSVRRRCGRANRRARSTSTCRGAAPQHGRMHGSARAAARVRRGRDSRRSDARHPGVHPSLAHLIARSRIRIRSR